MLVFTFILFLHASFTHNQDPFCCSKASGSCRSACEQMSMAALDANREVREKKLKAVKHVCPKVMVGFSQCFGEWLKKSENGDTWSGRECCAVAHSKLCQNACTMASHKSQLSSYCRRSDELEFFSCLTRQEEGDDCCGQGKTPECLQACRALYKSDTAPKKEERNVFMQVCSNSPKVLLCTKNLTKVTHSTNAAKYLHCCDRTTQKDCRDSCRRNLRAKTNLQEIFDSLEEEGCGIPMPHDELWQCFLQKETNADKISETAMDRAGMDGAKLHCCARAQSTACRRLCISTYSHEWMRTWADFNHACLNSLNEERLQTCIDEVDEPCELGCDGLSYCSNFNNRPTELFRSCTTTADEAARYDVEQWTRDGVITLPGLTGVQLPLRNVSSCSPEKWKAVACALQIKPCHRGSHGNRICKESCYDMLASCIDWLRMPAGQTVSSLCSKITSWPKGAQCVPLSDFLEPSHSPLVPLHDAVTSPCNHHPCDATELCVANKNCQSKKSCQIYKCLPGCRIGEASTFVVPWDTYVRVPVIKNEHKGCVKICKCSDNGSLVNCQPLPCSPKEECWLGSKKIEHGTTFYSNCNLCTCYSGEMTCSKRSCPENTSERVLGSSLPCKCPPDYMPVCGRNGYTYPNQCLAKCTGLSEMDLELGECGERDPCENSPCPHQLICVPMPRVCLSLLENPCRQYVCVNPEQPCSESAREAVCDSEQREHGNLCYMLRAGQSLSYRGGCLTDCHHSTGKVCGVNAITYSSECHALAEYSAVDYYGPCQQVAPITPRVSIVCPNVECPSLPRGGCMAITPPGACCPVCAGALKILYSRKQVDRALYALQDATVDLSMRGILAALHRQVKVTECRLWGHLTVEMDIFVAVSAPREASALQRQVCAHEAEKIASHIEEQSPRYMSELALSVLTAATPIHTYAQSSAICNAFPFIVLFYCLFCHIAPFLKN